MNRAKAKPKTLFCKNKKSRALNRPTDPNTVICKNWHGSTESWINYCLENFGVVPELKNKNTQTVSKQKEGFSINFWPATGTFNLTGKKHNYSKIIPQLTVWLAANDPPTPKPQNPKRSKTSPLANPQHPQQTAKRFKCLSLAMFRRTFRPF
jgi:hypothetical protein